MKAKKGSNSAKVAITRKLLKIIYEYIEIFYNRERLHSSIEYHSPEEYEKMTKGKISQRV